MTQTELSWAARPGVISLVLLLVAALALWLQSTGEAAALPMVVIGVWPMIVTVLLSLWLRALLSQNILLLANILYFLWIGWIYIEVFYRHPDPQGALALWVTGVLSLAVILPLWIWAIVKRRVRAEPSAE